MEMESVGFSSGRIVYWVRHVCQMTPSWCFFEEELAILDDGFDVPGGTAEKAYVEAVGKLESSGVETVMVLGLHLRRLGVEMMGFRDFVHDGFSGSI